VFRTEPRTASRPGRREDALHRASSPWENGYCESFNSKLRDELLAGEQFSTLHEAKVLIEQWRRHYNAIKPHSSLGYRPPAPETILPPASGRILT
jgi:transposase InsO family protein